MPFFQTLCADAADQEGGNSNRRLHSPASKVQFIDRSRQAHGFVHLANRSIMKPTIA
jgi:hypothetical protein